MDSGGETRKGRAVKSSDLIEQAEVMSLHSIDLAEDGRTVVALWNLAGDRTGVQSWTLGELKASHPIRVVD